MELQEIFNKAHKHFADMGEPSMASIDEVEDNLQCAYRGANGNKCIVGAFIPDELYKENLEGDSLSLNPEHPHPLPQFHNTRITEVLAVAFRQKVLTDDQYILLAKLQKAHDTNAEDWREERDSMSWYEYIKPSIISCANDFDLKIGDNHA